MNITNYGIMTRMPVKSTNVRKNQNVTFGNQSIQDSKPVDYDEARKGFWDLYDVGETGYSDNMNNAEQQKLIKNLLTKNQDKLTTDVDDKFAEEITKTMQNNKDCFEYDDVLFLERLLNYTKEKVSKEDLIDAISAVNTEGWAGITAVCAFDRFRPVTKLNRMVVILTQVPRKNLPKILKTRCLMGVIK